MAAGDLTSLANVKAYVGETGNGSDALIERMITAASAFVQSWLNRQLLSASYTYTFDGKDQQRNQLPQYPITAVSSVTVNGNVIPSSSGIWPQLGYVWDSKGVSLIGYSFTRGYQNCIVVYTAGYASVPYDIEQAVIEMISLRYKQRDRIGYNSKSIAGETVAFNTKDMDPSTATLLNNWRRVVPI